MENFIADPRGPAVSRSGFRFSERYAGNNAKIEFYDAPNTSSVLLVFLDELLAIQGILGSAPLVNFVVEPRFDNGGAAWPDVLTANAAVTFAPNTCRMEPGNGEVQISQAITTAMSGTQFVQVTSDGEAPYRIQCGTGVDDNTYFDITTSDLLHTAEISIPGTAFTITITADDGDVIIHSVYAADDETGVTFVTPYLEHEVDELYFVPSPDGSDLYVLHPNYFPTKIHVDAAGVFTFIDPVAFTDAPAEWASGSFPSCGDIFQGRLWLGGAPSDPQTFWASKSAPDIEVFTPGVADDDSFSATLSTFGLIQWILGTKNLLLGTINGEYIITAEAGVLTPTDHHVERQSSYGSAHVQPRQVGDQVFYVSPDRTKLRAMQYEWTANNWLSRDITFFSQHITAAKIKDLAWAQNPDNLLVMALDDGTSAWLTYERGEQIWGWHRHNTQGEFLDFTTGPLLGVSVIGAALKRVDGFIDIEAIFSEHPHYMDAYVEQTAEVPFTVVDGLDHLEGQTVQILADGAIQPDQAVSGGEVTLTIDATHAHVGLQYTPKLVTLPIEQGSPTGSGLAYIKRFNRLIIGLIDSAAPLINGKRVPTRHPPTPMGDPEPFVTGQVSIHQIGWSDSAIVTIEQDKPLPCTIAFIGGELPQEVT